MIAYIVTAAAIFALSLMSNTTSGAISGFFYDTISKIRYGVAENEEREAVKISSLSLTIVSDTYYVGTKTKCIVDKITPENFSETYSIFTSDSEIAKHENDALVFRKAGKVSVWAESASGVRSNVVELSVILKPDDDFIPDGDKMTVELPDSLPLNDACGLSVTYDGAVPKFSLDYSVEGDAAEVLANRYLVTKKTGTVRLNVSYNDNIITYKDITVTEECLSAPTVDAIYIEDRPIGELTTLTYDYIYSTSVKFASQNSCDLYVFRSKNGNVAYVLSPDKRVVRIYAQKIGEDELTVYSPTDISEPLFTFRINVLPPVPSVTRVPIAQKSRTATSYDAAPRLSDPNALTGITLSVETANGDATVDGLKVTFNTEGKYVLVYRSEYFEEFEYRYEVLVEDVSAEAESRKTFGHAGIFVVLGVFALLSLAFFPKNNFFKALFTALGGVVVAIISEILQLPIFSEGRNADVSDVFIDLAGFVIGVAVCAAVLVAVYLIRRRKSRSISSDTVE